MPLAATWVDLEIIILSEVSQKEKANTPLTPVHGIYKIDKLVHKTETDSQILKTNLTTQGEMQKGGIN